MTPQLQQAIKLLQLSNIELAEYVAEQLEENPFLERDESSVDGPEERRGTETQSEQKEDGSLDSVDLTKSETHSDAHEALDASYEDIDPNASPGEQASNDFQVNEWSQTSSSSGSSFGDDDRQFDAALSEEKSLKQHMSDQLHMATRDTQCLFIGAYIIDLIDDDGYLREALESIADRLGADLVDVEETHKIITAFEPIGVGARDLKECLTIQLREADRFDPIMEKLIANLELVGAGDLKGLLAATGADEEDVRDMVAEIRTLTPKPGLLFGNDAVEAVQPDIFVRQGVDGTWKIELNNDTLPRVLVNQHYYAEIANGCDSASDKDKSYVNDQFSNATWLAKSLDQRARTILKVAEEIVRQQDAFFAYGVKHLRPLNLKTVADAIEMHESTVSRVTSNKYMATARGLFELKYFFTASIASSAGGEAHSAEAVRHRIKELVSEETRETVLSDDKIVEILQGEGVGIARRTVAKYRETLNIPSSVQRRRAFSKVAL